MLVQCNTEQLAVNVGHTGRSIDVVGSDQAGPTIIANYTP
ncbi:Unknown protein sequence [Pseudomonas syringae pv. maculicola]|nr:Unknown protein sequence [Pseudomonas syringae pv. maculicola]